MFVAKDRELKSRVTSLDPEWGSRLEELRALAASGQLVCPGCEQLLRFRVGEQRRPHFAHRKVSECPLDRQSAEILEAKAKLYVWLCTKYPGLVEMDVDLQIHGWDRFADLVVRAPKGKTFAYWIFDRSPKNRQELLAYHPKGFSMTILFATHALNKEEDGSLRLSAGQRDFIKTSAFDPLRGFGHLHFLDASSGTLTIYRAFRCVCEPSLYEYHTIREAPLATAKICQESGEIVFQEDVDEYLHQKELKKQSRVFTPPVVPKMPAPVKETPVLRERPVLYEPPPRQAPVKPIAPPEPEWDGFYTCDMCGIRTKETSMMMPRMRTCICSKCLPEYNTKRMKELSRTRQEGRS
jgi:hypothetical protein